MSSFLGSFASEFRTLQRKEVTFGKDSIGSTTRSYGPPIDFRGILFIKSSNNVNYLQGSGQGGSAGSIARTTMTGELYLELDVTIKKGDIVIDAGKERKVQDIVPIYVFGGKLDHRKAFLSVSE